MAVKVWLAGTSQKEGRSPGMGSSDVGGRSILFPRGGAAGRVNSALEFRSQPFMVKK